MIMKNNTKNNIPNKTACLCGEQTSFRGDICKGGSGEKYVRAYERVVIVVNSAFEALEKKWGARLNPLPPNFFKTIVLNTSQLNKIIDKIKLSMYNFYTCDTFVSNSSMASL